MVVARHVKASAEESELGDVGEVVVLLVGVKVFRQLVTLAAAEGKRPADLLGDLLAERARKSFPELVSK